MKVVTTDNITALFFQYLAVALILDINRMENLPMPVNNEDLSHLGDIAAKAFGSKGFIDVCKNILGEQMTLLLFMKKAKREAEKARLMNAVELEKYLYTKAVDGFIQTDEGKHIMNAVGGSIIQQQLYKIGNLEAVIETAAEQLSQEDTPVSEAPVDSDWMARFFANAGEVSHEEMQKLWGRVLAGEIVKPGKFSLRTLEVLKNLSRKEAELINKVANYSLDIPGRSVLFGQLSDFNRSNKWITYSELLYLSEIGIIVLRDVSCQLELLKNEEEGIDAGIYFASSNHIICYGLEFLTGDTIPYENKAILPVVAFSTVGHQLLSLIEKKIEIAFLIDVQSFLMKIINPSSSKCYISGPFSNLEEARVEKLSFTPINYLSR
ncbi:DUF2806 domain-containing protein [Fibrella aquatica]|uniref:DUF2806 domain-containing protein n=1 Tax=Fibrella aquatica TaxID=3242487 RepID=UPI0035224E33